MSEPNNLRELHQPPEPYGFKESFKTIGEEFAFIGSLLVEKVVQIVRKPKALLRPPGKVIEVDFPQHQPQLQPPDSDPA